MKNRMVILFILVFLFSNFHIARAEQKTNVAAIVTSISGTLLVLPYGTEKWVEATKGMFLYEGDELKTGPNSKAAITFANGID